MGSKKNIAKLAGLVLAGSTLLSGCAALPYVGGGMVLKSVTDEIPQTKLEKRLSYWSSHPNNERDRYAVLLSSSSFDSGIHTAYDMIRDKGFQKDNIYILAEDKFRKESAPFDADGSKLEVKDVFKHLKKKVDDKDLLFVYLDGPATSYEGGPVEMRLPWPNLRARELGEYLSEHDAALSRTKLKKMLDKINADKIVVFSETWWANEMVKDFNDEKYVTISALEEGEMMGCDYFDYKFMDTFADSAKKYDDLDSIFEDAYSNRKCKEWPSDRYPWMKKSEGKVTLDK